MTEENRSRIKLMEQQYDELRRMFEERPSREEDVKLIQRLQQSLAMKEDELKRAWESLKFYKLELINRENVYNKMFNANPNVGILDPFEAKMVQFRFTQKVAGGTQKDVGFPSVNTKKGSK